MRASRELLPISIFNSSYLCRLSPFNPSFKPTTKEKQKGKNKQYNEKLPYHSFIAYTVGRVLKIKKELVCD